MVANLLGTAAGWMEADGARIDAMIHVYYRQNGTVVCDTLDAITTLPEHTLWVDAENASAEDEDALEALLTIRIPTRAEVWKNHAMNRMYNTDGVSYMTAALISKSDGPYPETHAVTFIVTEACLVTLRGISPTSFRNFAARLLAHALDFNSGPEIMEGLLEEMITRVAHNTELVMKELDDLNHSIFDPYGMQGGEENLAGLMQQVLRRLGATADLNSKVNESLHSFERLLVFFREDQADNLYLLRKLEMLMRDVRALEQQTGFVSDKITFQLDATLGMINVEQNVIMKVLSIFTVVIMPPTLIGSIYGMNFAHMPELASPWGYPAALALMLVVAAGPFWYFRYRRWL
jgi:magnesium transporter